MILSRRSLLKTLTIGATVTASGLILPRSVLAVSARQSGLNENISTYDSQGGRDYTALGTWQTNTALNLVANTTTEVLEGYGGLHDDSVQLVGAITSAQYHRIIRPAPGQGHLGKPGFGFGLNSTANADPVRIDESFGKVEDLLITYTCNTSPDIVGIRIVGPSNTSRAVGCIVYNGSNAGAGRAWGFDLDAGFFILCAAMNNEDVGFLQGNPAGTSFVYNSVAHGNGENGFWTDEGTMNCTNCIAVNNTGNDFNETEGADYAGSRYNVSGDGTAPGMASRTFQTVSFVNPGAGDAHLLSTDQGARGFGVSLAGDSDFPFDDDIDKSKWANDPAGWSMGIDAIGQRRRPQIVFFQ